jgi:hypothetical protein
MLRGSREFADRAAYEAFVRGVFGQVNAGRQARLQEELGRLKSLPATRLGALKGLRLRVGPGSTIRVQHNVYSVPSRLIGEQVEVRVFAERLEVWYGQHPVATLPRLRGEYRHRIEYRHIIDWLVRKPGAFAQYRYRQDLFPTSRFRMAYDAFCATGSGRADREYVQLLHLAARETETGVDDALRVLLARPEALTAQAVAELVRSGQRLPPATQVTIAPVDLTAYDALLQWPEVTP